MADSDEVDVANVLRIMVSTDNHLGYNEKDPIRGDDSFIAFEEMLTMAVEENVDFILLGGDLFHDAVPSQYALHKCMRLLRCYVFGDKSIEFEVLSDQKINFHSAVNQSVNYQDPNLNISIPVFSIHGNHDDPSSFGCLSSLDLLSTTGLVNYIGRWTDLNRVEVKPLLLRKGETKLGIYGLSHIHDERLSRLFETYKVQIEYPQTEHESQDDKWFNLMVLHQNRAVRGYKNYLPEESLPEFLHLIIWGHEHDCRIEPEYCVKKDFYISQPGSSVATSLAEGESIKKHVGILEIYKDKFKMNLKPLQTVRPFIFESLNLDEVNVDGSLDTVDAADKVQQLAEKRINEMIERSKELLTGHPDQPTIPLIRLRLEFTREEHMFNAIRFGQSFDGKVANSADVIHFKKILKRIKKEEVHLDKEGIKTQFQNMKLEANLRLEDLVERYFENADNSKKLQMMSTKLLKECAFQMIERRDAATVDNLTSNYQEKVLNLMMEKLPNENEIAESMNEIQDSFTVEQIDELLRGRERSNFVSTNQTAALKKITKNGTKKRKLKEENNESDDELAALNLDDLDGVNTTTTTTTTTAPPAKRGRGRGRGGTSTTTRGRGATTTSTASATVNMSSSSGSTRNTRTGHTMPALDVSIGNTSTRQSPRQKAAPSVLASLATGGAGIGNRRRPVKTYVISDSDSD